MASLRKSQGNDNHFNIIYFILSRSKSDIVPLLQWEVIPERVTFMEELGRGAFGKVYKGVFREFPSAEVFFKPREERVEVKEERVVAVKVLLGEQRHHI